MELYESLLTDDWLLGSGLAPAFYESDPVADDGLIKPCVPLSSNSDVDLLAKSFEDEGLGADLTWLDNPIDFSLLDSLELIKEEPKEPAQPTVNKDAGHLSEFQTAAIDLLESLMVENNSDTVSYTTLTPKSDAVYIPLDFTQSDDHGLFELSPVVSLDNSDSGLISPVSSCDMSILEPTSGMVDIPENMVMNPQWDASFPMSPEEVESLLSSPPCSPDNSLNSSDNEWLPFEAHKKQRDTPYSRPCDMKDTPAAMSRVKRFDPKTKKERKKVQNKNAATRYRQKKKIEADDVAGEFQILNDKNTELKGKVDEMEHEIQYMKGILQEIYKVKGLITA